MVQGVQVKSVLQQIMVDVYLELLSMLKLEVNHLLVMTFKVKITLCTKVHEGHNKFPISYGPVAIPKNEKAITTD